MKKLNVLNLYACLGGNRKLWTNCKVTAIELDSELARIYQEIFPNDIVIITDAHQFLLDHYQEFDFIWSSPPCPTHSRARMWGWKNDDRVSTEYPDMKLYQEIIFLDNFFDGKYCIENVIPYYEPLIPGTKIGRHIFWSNFIIPQFKCVEADINRGNISSYEKLHNIDVSSYKGTQRKDKILRNMVHYDTGLYIFELAQGIISKSNTIQKTLWD